MKWSDLLMECEDARWATKTGLPNNLKVYMLEIRRRLIQTKKNNTPPE